MTVMDKKELRRLLRDLRGTQQERDAQSAAICRHIISSEAYRNAKVIAGYAAMQHEADITAVLKTALEQGKTVVMPLCGTAPQMTLRRIKALGELQTGRYGIPEPPACAPVVDVKDVDMLFVPLEGIDPAGYRLGKGGGYYDHLLSMTDAYSLGCALSWQIVADGVPRDTWDMPLFACADMYGLNEFRVGSRKDADDGYQKEGPC